MEDKPLKQIIREVIASFSELIRSELHLARAEAADNTRELMNRGKTVAICAAFLYLGVLAFLAAAVIALGNVFEGNFALSAFCIGLLVTVPAAFLGIRAAQSLRNSASFPITKSALHEDRETVSEGLQEVKDQLKHPESQQRAS